MWFSPLSSTSFGASVGEHRLCADSSSHGAELPVPTICSRVDSPHYRLIFDPAPTVFAGEDPLQALHEMMPFLAHVHLKNVLPVNDGEQWHRTQEDHQRRQYRGVNLSEGIIDLPAVLKKLQQQNYQGKFLIEYQGEEDPRDALKKNLVEAQALLKQAGFTT